jgi:hypothetical protein
MSRVLILLSASLLLLNGCGRTVSTVDSAYLKPSTSSTLADKNRHDLMASSHLETGVQYVIPEAQGTPQPKVTTAKKSVKATSEEETTDAETADASSEKKN